MNSTALTAALETEHRTIDEVLERYVVRTPPGEGPAARGRPSPSALVAAVAALRRHIYVEEELLFPALYAGGDARLIAGMLAGLREHARIWHLLDRLGHELEQGSDPGPVSRLTRTLLVALQHHNLREERVVYAAVDQGLQPAAAAHLAAFLETGQMPNDWVCSKARS